MGMELVEHIVTMGDMNRPCVLFREETDFFIKLNSMSLIPTKTDKGLSFPSRIDILSITFRASSTVSCPKRRSRIIPTSTTSCLPPSIGTTLVVCRPLDKAKIFVRRIVRRMEVLLTQNVYIHWVQALLSTFAACFILRA
jgi:hypothetical protein